MQIAKLSASRLIVVLITTLAIAVMLNAHTSVAEYSSVGGGTIDMVRVDTIKPACTYRVKGVLSPTRKNSYEMGYHSQRLDSNTYILERILAPEEVAELASLRTTLFFTTVPTFYTTSGSTASLLRLTASASQAARLELIAGGRSYPLRTSFFELEEECAPVSSLTYSGTSGGCGMLGVKEADGSCRCFFAELTSGTNTVCHDLSAMPFGSGRPQCWMMGTSNRCFGPAATGLERAYVFDAPSCSCVLCNPIQYNRSVDERSCVCKFRTGFDVEREYGWMTNQGGPGPGGEYGASAAYNYMMRCRSPRAYFDAAACECRECPMGKTLDADHTSCS